MVAPLLLLHHRLAVAALPELQVVLKKADLVTFTCALVLGEEALAAVRLAALVALGSHSLLDDQDTLLALLVGTEALVVLGGLVEDVHFGVLLLELLRETLVEGSLQIHGLGTGVGGTGDLLESGDLVVGVLAEA